MEYPIKMGSNYPFEIRDPRTHNFMGYSDQLEHDIYISPYGQLKSFIGDYKALENEDIGIAVEMYDVKQKKIDHFSLLYHFKDAQVFNGNIFDHLYYVFSLPCTNLEMLEYLYFYNKLKELK